MAFLDAPPSGPSGTAGDSESLAGVDKVEFAEAGFVTKVLPTKVLPSMNVEFGEGAVQGYLKGGEGRGLLHVNGTGY